MNEYNHHRIIERVALDRGLDASIKKIFIKASDLTDSIMADPNYFFYRNYYTIEAKNNTIQLNRVTGDTPYLGMVFSGEKKSSGFFSLTNWNEDIDKKEFFSAVNERRKSAHFDGLDTGNQSDNVAFLHAMGAEGESMEDSRSIFENHLKKCFAEYLFLENEKDALFMLGIAFHGIMDSFTPSHMDFQKYTEQDMGLHAQGDVIPIMGKFEDGELLEGNFSEKEKVSFNPGQYSEEKGIMKPLKRGFIRSYKYYNGDDYLNPIEEEMFRIFLYISDIQTKDNVGGWKSLNVEAFLKTFSNNKKEINSILEKTIKVKKKGKETEEPVYIYGPESYAYSEAAIRVISDIYKYLSKKREECKSFSEYKDNKQEVVDDALNTWKRVYDGKENVIYMVDHRKEVHSMKTIRDRHIGLSLYYKDPELEKWKEQQAQQDIDRLNRLKG